MKTNIALILITLFYPAFSIAGEGRILLDKFLTQTNTMSANFKQVLQSSEGNLLQESEGQFYLQRPGKFRWNYTSPYPQEIVSDGDNVWIFDVDLEQVTVQKQASTLNNTPMALIESRENLETAFEIIERGEDAGMQRIELRNRKPDADFSRILLGLDEQGLRYLQLFDQFEQTTYIHFLDLESNPELDAAIFEFTPPEGVDVFGGG